MKNVRKFVIGVLVIISAFAAIAFIVPKFISKTPTPIMQRLDDVEGLEYDDQLYRVIWKEVKNADAYLLDINGDVVETHEAYYNYVPVEDTAFKVKAKDSTETYEDSNWSKECIYKIPENTISMPLVHSFVTKFVPSQNVKKVIFIHAEGNELYTGAVFDDGKIYQFRTVYAQDITSIREAIDLYEQRTYNAISEIYTIKNYDSMKYYLMSDQYITELENYRQQGYEFKIVNQQSYYINEGSMGDDFILRLSKGNEVKYVSASLKFLSVDTANESVKYTTALQNFKNSRVTVNHFVELDGDFVEFAQLYETD